MKRNLSQTWRSLLALLLSFALMLLVMAPVEAQGETAVSKPGMYSGYSQPIYDEWIRTSQYVSVRDGTKLAVDIFRPARDGVAVSKPFPVIWTHDRYHRADIRDGKLITQLEQGGYQWLEPIPKYGYVIGVVDVRGGGASYGTRYEPFDQPETWDAYDITEWFAAQPWCDGKVGMFGRSYLGITQYMAASTTPPHLVCIFPEMAWFDSYSFSYPGGVFHNAFIKKWGELVKFLDQGSPAAPVDEDSDRSMLRAAFNEHKGNSDVYETFKRLPYRNSWDQETNSAFHLACSPTSYISEIENSGVAIYHLAGWYDGWPRDQLLWFNNLKNPQKIIIGPWHHGDRGAIDWTAEHLRWFDYWLKGIDNGIIDEPPIYYYTMGAIKGKEWRFARQWPLANEKPTLYYLRSGPSGSVNSINDGFLSRRPPTSTTGKDEYTVDYTTTTGITNRWTAMYGAKFDYPDMTENDKKGLTYTTPPLASDVEVTGHPMVHLWISSTATDGDFFAYLEEVDAEGLSHYITEGTLRASHRSLSTPPFEYIGLPWHRSFKEDCDDLPKDKPVELVFDLHPTSNIFDAGHRIRVTITCADKDNNLTPELSPAPRVSVYRNTNYASYIKLPVIPVAIK